MRRALAIVLLCAHAAAAVHLALASHVTSADSGAIVEAEPKCDAQHGGAGIEHGHQLAAHDEQCEAVLFVRSLFSAQAVAAVVPVVPAPRYPRAQVQRAAQAAPLEVLSVAPKSSPPV